MLKLNRHDKLLQWLDQYWFSCVSSLVGLMCALFLYLPYSPLV